MIQFGVKIEIDNIWLNVTYSIHSEHVFWMQIYSIYAVQFIEDELIVRSTQSTEHFNLSTEYFAIRQFPSNHFLEMCFSFQLTSEFISALTSLQTTTYKSSYTHSASC